MQVFRCPSSGPLPGQLNVVGTGEEEENQEPTRPASGNFTTTTVSKQQRKSPSFSREGTLASRKPVLTDAHPSSSSLGSCSSVAISAVADGEVLLPPPRILL